jgi:hypothetical protein
MKQYFFPVAAICFMFSLYLAGCKKTDNTPCPDITVFYSKVNANTGQSNGSITVTGPKGAGYLYNINDGPFQADSSFKNLGIGTYTIKAKSATNCTGSLVVSLTDICSGVTVTPVTTKFDAITGQTNGSVTVTSPVGSGITYSLNGGPFQSSTNFNNLGVGTYTVTAKTASNCTGSGSVTIVGYGPKYYAVKTLINGYCGPCHLNGGMDGGVNWDTDASIVSKWDRIKARAVDNIPSVMPQTGPLTTVDKQKITDWVNAGHTINN